MIDSDRDYALNKGTATFIYLYKSRHKTLLEYMYLLNKFWFRHENK